MIDALLGFFAGMLSGFIPGMHINSLAQLSSSDEFMITAAGSFLISSVFQMVFFLSSVQEVAALPLIGRLLKREGRLSVLIYHSLGVIIGLVVPLLIYKTGALKSAYWALKPYIWLILLISSLLLIIKSKERKKYAALFLLSGVVGWVAINNIREAFFIMFSGFFALPLLLERAGKERHVKLGSLDFDKKSLASSLLGSVLGFFAILLPGISSPSIMATVFLPAIPSGTSYISLLSSITASQYLYGGYAKSEIGIERLGWLKSVAEPNPYLLLTSSLFALALSLLLVRKLKSLSLLRVPVLVYIVGLSFYYASMWGLLLLFASYAIGRLSIEERVERTAVLGSLLLPTLVGKLIPMLLF
ncbi:MAG: hypothetical protein D6769_01925 [Methanobacteriota archaeon]|nr:MAG: hypothetical protein D6769_01925 [Euryarchaeota archaeon]